MKKITHMMQLLVKTLHVWVRKISYKMSKDNPLSSKVMSQSLDQIVPVGL
jgi:hypothetical protein